MKEGCEGGRRGWREGRREERREGEKREWDEGTGSYKGEEEEEKRKG